MCKIIDFIINDTCKHHNKKLIHLFIHNKHKPRTNKEKQTCFAVLVLSIFYTIIFGIVSYFPYNILKILSWIIIITLSIYYIIYLLFGAGVVKERKSLIYMSKLCCLLALGSNLSYYSKYCNCCARILKSLHWNLLYTILKIGISSLIINISSIHNDWKIVVSIIIILAYIFDAWVFIVALKTGTQNSMMDINNNETIRVDSLSNIHSNKKAYKLKTIFKYRRFEFILISSLIVKKFLSIIILVICCAVYIDNFTISISTHICIYFLYDMIILFIYYLYWCIMNKKSKPWTPKSNQYTNL